MNITTKTTKAELLGIINQLNADITELSNISTERSVLLQERDAKIADLQEQLDEQTSKNNEMAQMVNNLRDANVAMNNEINNLKKDPPSNESVVMSALRAELEESQVEASALRQQLSSVKAELRSVQTTVDSYQALNAEQSEYIQLLERTNADLQDRLGRYVTGAVFMGPPDKTVFVRKDYEEDYYDALANMILS